MENELEVPSGAPLAVWEWLCGAGRDTIRLAVIGRIPGEEVLRRALDVLRDPQAGDDLQELAETVVAHATDLSIVTDDTIRALVDGEPGPARASRLTSILESLHTNRGIPSALLRDLRDRWARSQHVHLRVEAVTVAGLLPGLDVAFSTKMLDDPSPRVQAPPSTCSSKPTRWVGQKRFASFEIASSSKNTPAFGATSTSRSAR